MGEHLGNDRAGCEEHARANRDETVEDEGCFQNSFSSSFFLEDGDISSGLRYQSHGSHVRNFLFPNHLLLLQSPLISWSVSTLDLSRTPENSEKKS